MFILKNEIFENKKEFNEEAKKSILLNFQEYNRQSINARLAVKILTNIFNIKYEVATLNGEEIFKYYKKDECSEDYIEYTFRKLAKDLNLITDSLNAKNDIKTLTEQTLFYLDTSDHSSLKIKQIKIAPEYLIKLKNGIFNKKSLEFVPKDNDLYKKFIDDYDFTQSFTFDYLSDIKDDNNYLLVWNKLLNDLSNNNPNQKLLFEQITSAVIEGNGRGKYIMLSGQAGSGKTTFGNVLLNIAGDKYTRYVTMDSFDNDNVINTLNMSTKFTLGDDLQKSANLSGVALRNFKTLVDGNRLSVGVKYEPNRIVQTKCVWLQMMNDNPNIFEANDAIRDRTILLTINGRNHRTITEPAEKEFSKRLDNYTGKYGKADENFIQVVVSYILKNVNYFDDFTISDEMRKDTEDMINHANWAYQFVEWLNDMGFLGFRLLPAIDIHELLYYWIDRNNPKMIKPASRNINKEIEPYMYKYGFIYDNNKIRLTKKSITDYNREIIEQELLDLYKGLPKSTHIRPWLNNDNIITKSEVNDFLNNFSTKDYNELTLKEKVIVKALIMSGDIDVISWYSQFLD